MRKVVPIWKVKIKDGKLGFYQKEEFQKYLTTLEGEGRLTLQKWYKPRSDRENRYWWGVVIEMIANHIGEEDREAVHAMVQMAIGNTKDVAGVLVPAGTSHRSTAEFEDIASRARMWAAKTLELYIPLPNEAQASGYEY